MTDYVPLTLRYRPARFSDLIGQDVVVKTLTTMMERGRVFPGLVFAGSRGTGKTTAARILAKALNCLDLQPGQEPCGTCDSCRAIQDDTSMLVQELDAASHGGVDDVRSLKDQASYGALGGRYRVWIIDEAHSLSRPAWDAFLKLLEEPPGPCCFIFCSTEISRFPDTILSRCMTFTFRRQSVESLIQRLTMICQREGIDADAEAIRVMAESSEGGVRDAISLLDQARSWSGGKIGQDHVYRLLGHVADATYFRVIEAVLSINLREAHRILDEVFSEVSDGTVVVNGLIRLYRDLFFAFNGIDIRDRTDEYRDKLAKMLPRVTSQYLANGMEVLFQVQAMLARGNIRGRHILDFSLVKLLPPTRIELPPAKPQKVTVSFDELEKFLGAEEVTVG